MVVLVGMAVSYERGTPVVSRTSPPPSVLTPPRASPPILAGDTTSCKVTPVILHKEESHNGHLPWVCIPRPFAADLGERLADYPEVDMY